MTLNAWTEILSDSFQTVLQGSIAIIPNIVVAVILVILGWIIGAALSKVIAQIFKSVKVDKALTSAGLDDLVEKAGFRLNSGKFIGEIVKWFTIVIFLTTSLEVLGLNQVNDFLQDVVIAYIPNVLAAVLIVLVAAVIAEALKKTVVASAKAAGVTASNFLGALTKWSIWIFALLAALFQLGIGAVFIQTLFTGVVVALALAFGLAFGLGGKDHASQVVEKIKREISNHS